MLHNRSKDIYKPFIFVAILWLTTVYSLIIINHLPESSYRYAIYILIIVGLISIFLMARKYCILYQELLVETTLDKLTGVYNRAFFNYYLAKKHKLKSRHNYTISFILIDIDDFKSYNNKYGISAGDECIMILAGVISKYSPTESIFRYGGDEFLISLHDVPCDKVASIAFDILKAIRSAGIRIEDNPPQNLTVSIGVNISDCSSSKEGLIRYTEEALQRSKENGKDCVTIHVNHEFKTLG